MNSPKECILLVEDDPKVSDLLCDQILNPLGYQVKIVRAVATAIQEAIRCPPDLILTKLNLPGLSGKDLLVALNAQRLEIPVVIIAPKGMENDVIQAFRFGASDLIYWPIREVEVATVIERVLHLVRGRREKELLSNQLDLRNRELQQRARELTTIFAIGKAVLTSSDQQDLYRKILEGALYISEADLGWLLEREDPHREFFIQATLNVTQETIESVDQPWEDGLGSLVAQSGEPLSLHGELLRGYKLAQLGQSALVVPLKVKKAVIGLLVVLRKSPQPFSRNQQTLVEAICGYASINMVNASLFRALENRANAIQLSMNNALLDKHINEEVMVKTAQELQNRLQNVKINTDKIMAKELGRVNAHQEAALRLIQEQVRSGLEIVDLLLTMSKSQDKVKSTQVNINELIVTTAQRLQPFAQKDAIIITYDLPDTPLIVQADQSQIIKVLEGLITNAIQFSLHGDEVNIHVERASESTVRVEVHDHGVGIDPKELPEIFLPGLQKASITSSRIGGVGISLPLMNKIISNHGGKLWAESQPAKGSIFFFTLKTTPSQN